MLDRTGAAYAAPAVGVRARDLWFTPFSNEPVGWLIEQAGNDLFLFSSDYPHPEGGHDPLKRFESCLADLGEDARERFYAQNFNAMMGTPA